MALEGRVSVADYETQPESIPEGQVAFVKDKGELIVNHGDREIVYGKPVGLYKGPGRIRYSTTDVTNDTSFGLCLVNDNVIVATNQYQYMWKPLAANNTKEGEVVPKTAKRVVFGTGTRVATCGMVSTSNGVIPTDNSGSNGKLRIIDGIDPSEGLMDVYTQPAMPDNRIPYFIGAWLSSPGPSSAVLLAQDSITIPRGVGYRNYQTGPLDQTEPYPGTKAFFGAQAIRGVEGFVYIPHDANYVQEIMLDSLVGSVYGTCRKTALVKRADYDTQKFIGGTTLPNGEILFCPFRHPYIGIYNPYTKTYRDGPAHECGDYAFRGAYTLPDGLVVLGPRSSGCVGLYDYITDKFHRGCECLKPVNPLDPGMSAPQGGGLVIRNSILFTIVSGQPPNKPSNRWMYYPEGSYDDPRNR